MNLVEKERRFAQIIGRMCDKKNHYRDMVRGLQTSLDEAKAEIKEMWPALLEHHGQCRALEKEVESLAKEKKVLMARANHMEEATARVMVAKELVTKLQKEKEDAEATTKLTLVELRKNKEEVDRQHLIEVEKAGRKDVEAYQGCNKHRAFSKEEYIDVFQKSFDHNTSQFKKSQCFQTDLTGDQTLVRSG